MAPHEGHDARIAVLESQLAHLEESIERLQSAVEALTAALNKVRGGWGLITMIGIGLGAMVAASTVGDKIAAWLR